MFAFNDTQQLQLFKYPKPSIQFSLAALVVRNQSISIDYAYKQVGNYLVVAKLQSAYSTIYSSINFTIYAGE
jgi:hypothetical protein